MIKDREYKAILHIVQFIQDNLDKHYTIEELARRAGLNQRALKSGFRMMYGMGVYAYLKKERMNKAKEHLQMTHQSIFQIARMVGFKSISSFSNAFRKQFKQSPTDWRKGLIEWVEI